LPWKWQECEAEVQKVRDIESNKERQFLMEQSQVAATMQAKTEAKISALSCEVMALKECYDTARMACQVSITHNRQWVIVFSNVRINSFCIQFHMLCNICELVSQNSNLLGIAWFIHKPFGISYVMLVSGCPGHSQKY
jgi:hypothetical protein